MWSEGESASYQQTLSLGLDLAFDCTWYIFVLAQYPLGVQVAGCATVQMDIRLGNVIFGSDAGLHNSLKNKQRLLSSYIQLIKFFSLTKNMEAKCHELHLSGTDCQSL